MMRFAVASGSAPSSPYPTSTRILRSRTNTNSTTPLSSLARPARHAWAVRTVKSSSEELGGKAGKVATRIWFEVSSSNCLSRAFRRASTSAGRMPAWSVTKSRGTGGGDCAAAAVASISHSGSAASTSGPPARGVISGTLWSRRRGRRPGGRGRAAEVEVHVRRALRPRGRPEVRLLLESHHSREQRGREAEARGVVGLRGLVVPVALHVDAVLGAFELGLQVAEVRVGLELGVALHHHHQARQRAGELVLAGLPPR